MNRGDLRAQFRLDADDVATPYLFSDTEANAWLVEAVEEAALRADLLLEVDDAAVCTIATTADLAGYALHASITRVMRAQWTTTGGSEALPLTLIERRELDRVCPSWRELAEEPTWALLEAGKIRLAGVPTTDGSIQLECYRMPLTPMAADADLPELEAKHHRYLIQWALWRAYGRPDTETYDATRADRALAAFERQFGRRPDSGMRQGNETAPQFNQAYF